MRIPADHFVDTPLGLLQFWAGADEGTVEIKRFAVCEPEYLLPPGMSVEGMKAVYLRVRAVSAVRGFSFACDWESLSGVVGHDSGQGLDAQTWNNGEYVVSVGTEDSDLLQQRMPWLELSESEYPVKYSPTGMAVRFPCIPKGKELSLHFAVAGRSLPDPEDCSTWFAVDIPHRLVQQAN